MKSFFSPIRRRILRSIRNEGLARTLARVVRQFVTPRSFKQSERSDFDLTYNVHTAGTVSLADLKVTGPNWLHGTYYEPTRNVEHFRTLLSSLNIPYEDFIFVDFGSGRGRALLLASEFPFSTVIGIEFAAELHADAVNNIASYRGVQKCKSIRSVLMDFVDYQIPPVPLVAYLYNPCTEMVLSRVIENLQASLEKSPRPCFVIYLSAEPTSLFNKVKFLNEVRADGIHRVFVNELARRYAAASGLALV